MKAFKVGVQRVSRSECLREVAQNICRICRVVSVQSLYMLTEMDEQVLSVHESASNKRLELERHWPAELSHPSMEDEQLLRREETLVESLNVRPYGTFEICNCTQFGELPDVGFRVENDTEMMSIWGHNRMGLVEAIKSLAEFSLIFPVDTCKRTIESFTLKHRRGEQLEAYDCMYVSKRRRRKKKHSHGLPKSKPIATLRRLSNLIATVDPISSVILSPS